MLNMQCELVYESKVLNMQCKLVYESKVLRTCLYAVLNMQTCL